MRIMVVDDEPFVRDICARSLRQDGHEVETAAGGEEAAARLGEPWDVVLTDVVMPGRVGGLELTRRVRSGTSADTLVMTAYADLDTAIGALQAGAYDFIPKPFQPELLRAAVRRCADKRLLSAELSRERALREELARMQKARDAFGLFVTEEVAEYVLSLPAAQRGRGRLRRVTVLFADVRKFTPFAEAVPPETAVETLNSFFSCIIDALGREGGILNKFIGDGILALFGAPLDLGGHERAAARAALRAMEAIEELNRGRAGAGQPPLRVGIGVNTGEVVAGCLGTQTRAEYSVIGHAVNLAARLEKAAAPGQILIGPATARALGEDFDSRAVAPLALKGISDAGEVRELIRERQAYGASAGR